MNWEGITDKKIIAVVREHEAGAKAADAASKNAVRKATHYKLKAAYGRLGRS